MRHYRFSFILGLCLVCFWSTTKLIQAQTPAWIPTGSLQSGRYWHTATLLPNGKVLVVRGCTDIFCSNALSSAELYDPATGGWQPETNPLHTARERHTATLLSNGKVLVVGGKSCDLGCANQVRASRADVNSLIPFGPDARLFDYLGSAELYDPVTGVWTQNGSLTIPRAFHTATLLSDGKVLAMAAMATTPFKPAPNCLIRSRVSGRKPGHSRRLA